MSRKLYTTVEVAKAASVPRATLQHWIKTGKISPPPVRLRRNRAVRLWTDTQKKRIRELRALSNQDRRRRLGAKCNQRVRKMRELLLLCSVCHSQVAKPEIAK
jgi:hypothetical protein